MKKLVALVLTFLLILTGCKEVKVTKVKDDIKTDSIKFSSEYNITKENVYEYSTYGNVIETIDKKTGIIYLGFPKCDLCKEIVPILNEAAKENNVNSILYYNFKEIRANNTAEYQSLVNRVSDYIKSDDEGTKRITAPTVIFVNKGDIVGVYIGIVSSENEEVITEEQKIELKNNFNSLINKMLMEKTTTQEITQ